MRGIAAIEVDHFGHGQEALDARRLQDDPDALAHPFVALCGIETEHGHLARRALAKALEDLDGRGLPRTVGAEEREDLTVLDGHVDGFDGLELSIRLAQAFDDDRSHERERRAGRPAL